MHSNGLGQEDAGDVRAAALGQVEHQLHGSCIVAGEGRELRAHAPLPFLDLGLLLGTAEFRRRRRRAAIMIPVATRIRPGIFRLATCQHARAHQKSVSEKAFHADVSDGSVRARASAISLRAGRESATHQHGPCEAQCAARCCPPAATARSASLRKPCSVQGVVFLNAGKG